MRGKKELLKLVTGLVLFIFDLGSDTFVAVKYFKNGELWWFAATIFITFFSLFCITIAARYQMKTDRLNSCWVCLFLSIFRRYYKEFKQWKRTYWDKSPCAQNCRQKSCESCQLYLEEETKFGDYEYNLAIIRYIETICESAPQWCLQVYIMLRQWYFPWYTVLSVVFSLLSLAWNITALEKAREIREPKQEFTLKSTIMFLLWQLSCLVSRLVAIVIFAYVFKSYVFAVLGVHLTLVNATVTISYSLSQNAELLSIIQYFLQISCINFPFVFHSSGCVLKWSRIELYPTIFMNYASISLENIIMVILSVAVSRPDVTHMSILTPITISCVVTGLVLGTICFVLYYKFYNRAKVLPFLDRTNFNSAVVDGVASHIRNCTFDPS